MQGPQTTDDSPVDRDGRWDPIAWSDEYATGHMAIDTDHQRLLALFNEFSNAVNESRSEAVIGTVLDLLVDYTRYHFSREEQLMQESQYTDYARHKKMHDTFIRQIGDVRHHLSVGSDMSAFLLSFLAQWLSGHILGADRKLGHHLLGRDLVTH